MARLVAAARGWARWLPPPLCHVAPDPHGGALAGGVFAWLDALGSACPPLARLLLRITPAGAAAAAITLRTRCLDDAVREFWAAGGHQVVLLGAGMEFRRPLTQQVIGRWQLFEAIVLGAKEY